MNHLVAWLAGLLFGAGLLLSQMVDPARVVGFLDVFGVWDPTLLFVMGAALVCTVPGFWWASRLGKPWLEPVFVRPARDDIDRPLIVGAILFGLGWGLAGLCPGPAIVAVASAHADVLLFLCAMLLGMALNRAPRLLGGRRAS